jgi:hypothetical protein
MTYQRLAKTRQRERAPLRVVTASTGSRLPFCCRGARHSAARRGATRLRSMATRDRSHRTPDACSRPPELPKRLREALAARRVPSASRRRRYRPDGSLATGMLWLKDVGECVRAAEVTKAKQERRVSEPGRNLSYGDYILRTGRGIIGAFELVFGAFLYQKFKGRSRIVDVGPGRCWFPKQNPQAIIAVDNSPELVEYFSKQGIDIRLGDAYNLQLPDAYADGVLSVRSPFLASSRKFCLSRQI